MLQTLLNCLRWKPLLAKVVAVQSMAQSVNNVFQSVLKTTEDKEAIETSGIITRNNYAISL